MRKLTPEHEIELETFLNNYLEESMGADDASLSFYRDEIVCQVYKPRAIRADSPSAEMFEFEFRDMADQLIETLAREPFQMDFQLYSVWRNGFTLTAKEN